MKAGTEELNIFNVNVRFILNVSYNEISCNDKFRHKNITKEPSYWPLALLLRWEGPVFPKEKTPTSY